MSEKEIKKMIERTVHALTGTIIVANEGWGETIPEWIKLKITEERMIQNMERLRDPQAPDVATDAECLAYLYTLTLTTQVSPATANIYAHLMRRYKPDLPPSVGGVVLTDEEERSLQSLRRDIRRDSLKAFKSKLKGERTGGYGRKR